MKDSVVIGVDLGGTKVQTGRVEGGNIAEKYQRKISADSTDENKIIEEILESIERVINDKVEAIGIGVPSLVDVDKGIVYNVENIPSWKKVHLKEKVENEFNLPVFINNDANCFALGEFRYGKGKGFKHIVGLTIGTGLGSGIIINGKLYYGANCGAGEIGSIPYKDSIIENYASGQFFKLKYGSDGKTMSERAKRGDNKAIEAYEELGKNIGIAIKVILSLYDPEMIVLGGSISLAFDLFKNSMFREINKFPFKHVINNLKIEVSEKKEIPVLGAASLYFDSLV